MVIANKQPREDVGLPSGEMAIVPGTFTHSQWKFQGLSYRPLLFYNAKEEAISLVTMNARLRTSSGSRRVKLTIA